MSSSFTENINGSVVVKSTVASTTPTTGALIISGGLGVSGNIYATGNINTSSTTASTSSTTGALIISGGLGVGGNIYATGSINTSSTTASTSSTTGALIISGGLGVGGAINLAGTAGNAVNIGTNLILATGSGNFIYGSASSGDISLCNTNTNGKIFIGINGTTGQIVTTANVVAININTPSTSPSTGALVVGNTTGGLGVYGNIYAGGSINTISTTASTSSTTGAAVVAGGLGVGGNIYTSGVINTSSTTASTTTSTGAAVVAGGLGVGGNVNIGGSLNIANTINISNNGISNSLNIGTPTTGGNFTYSGTVGTYFTNTAIGDVSVRNASSTNTLLLGVGMASSQMTINNTNINILPTTASTSSTTGALTVAGGAGFSKPIYTSGISANLDTNVTVTLYGAATSGNCTVTATMSAIFGIITINIGAIVPNGVPTQVCDLVLGTTQFSGTGTAILTAYNLAALAYPLLATVTSYTHMEIFTPKSFSAYGVPANTTLMYSYVYIG